MCVGVRGECWCVRVCEGKSVCMSEGERVRVSV